MKLKVTDKNDKLEIENMTDNVKAIVPYQPEKSYFGNVVQWIGDDRRVVDFESLEEYDVFTIEEIKR